MELSTRDRVVLLHILPDKGSYLTLKIVRELRESLSFTEEEMARLRFRDVDGGVQWDTSGDVPREYELGPTATGIVVSALKELDEREALGADTFRLYEMFVEN